MARDRQAPSPRRGLFTNLDTDVANRISALRIRRAVKVHEVLFLKGDEGDAFYEVESGQIRISACAPGGREVILATMGPGDAFGEIALLDGLARTADAIATCDSELLMVRRRDFVALLEREPRLAVSLLELVCERVRRISEQVEDSVLLDLPGRLAKQILNLAVQNQGQTPNPLWLRASQTELGHMLGTSRVSINKHLQRWRKNGWVALGRGQVVIHDPEALERVVNARLDD